MPSDPHPTTAEHAQFDSLCEGLEEYDALPAVSPSSSLEPEDDAPDQALDEQILAGLVSPY